MVGLFTPYCTSFGSQTQAGSNFVARLLTLVKILKFQKRYDKIIGGVLQLPLKPLLI